MICSDNDVDVHTDNLRMTWAMADLVKKRAPLSWWHADFKGPFAAFLAANSKQRGTFKPVCLPASVCARIPRQGSILKTTPMRA